MSPIMGFSTSWGRGRFASLLPFFAEARAMGFGQYELAGNWPSDMLKELAPRAFPIVSLHSPCAPTIDQTAEAIEREGIHLAASDGGRRAEAVELARRTIEFAAELGARVVVLHLGTVESEEGTLAAQKEALRVLYEQGQADAPEYAAGKERLLALRAERQPLNFALARQSLAELVAVAQRYGVKLGLENRFQYYQIPNLEEMGLLLNGFEAQVVYYWHDTGHAQTLANLGLTSPREWLERYGPRLLGLHLQDTWGVRDRHLAPGMGEVDFGMVVSLAPREALWIVELNKVVPRAEVEEGQKFVERLFRQEDKQKD